jgi:hypothetical protein
MVAKEQIHETGDIEWETKSKRHERKYEDVREGTKDVLQGREKETEELVTGRRKEKRLNALGAPK